MIIDACIHVGDSLYNNGAEPEEVVQAMEYLGADKAVLCPVKPKSYNLSEANDYIIDLVNKNNNYIGLVRVDPNLENKSKKEIKRGVEKGLKGIYLHPWEENFQINSPIVEPIIEIAKKNGLPVMIEAGFPWVSHATQVLDLARRFNDVKFIITNAGQLDLSGFSLYDVGTLLKSCSNVSVITNTAVGTGWLASIINDVSAERVLFGTGLPVFDPRLEILRIEYLEGVKEEDKNKVLGENTLKLFE